MSHLPNQYERYERVAEIELVVAEFRLKDAKIASLSARLKAIREVFLRTETSCSFADQREAYQEMRKLILEGGDVT